MIVGRALAISSDFFSNVGVGDFPDLHFQFLSGTRVPNSSEASILWVESAWLFGLTVFSRTPGSSNLSPEGIIRTKVIPSRQ
jgi:hypothetical protein